MIIKHSVAIFLYAAIGVPCAAVSAIAAPFRAVSAWSFAKAEAHFETMKASRSA